MPPARSSKQTQATRQQRALVDALAGTETKHLLAAMLDAQPELVATAAALADAQLGAVTVERVADAVTDALGALRIEDVWERSGTQPDGGYVETTEAAWEVVGETVAPFVEDLARRIALGRRAEATMLCQGTLLGLYRISRAEGEFLDGHAPDSLEEAAADALAAWKKGRMGRAGTGARARQWAAMSRFVSDALPAWRSFLLRTLGPAPTRGRKKRERR